MPETVRRLAPLAALPVALLALAGCAGSGGASATPPLTATAGPATGTTSQTSGSPAASSTTGATSASGVGSADVVRLGDHDYSSLDWQVECTFSVTADAMMPDGNRLAIQVSGNQSSGQAESVSVNVYGPGNSPVETWVIDDAHAGDGAVFTQQAFDRGGAVAVSGTAAGGSWGTLGVSYDEQRPIEVLLACPPK